MSTDIRARITNPDEAVEFKLGSWPLVEFLAKTIPASIILVLIFVDSSCWYFWPLMFAVCMTWVEMACLGLPKSPPTLALNSTEIIGPQGTWRLAWDQVAYFECFVADYLSDVNHLGVYVYQKGSEKPCRGDGFFSVSAEELEQLLRQRLIAYRVNRGSKASSLGRDIPSTT